MDETSARDWLNQAIHAEHQGQLSEARDLLRNIISASSSPDLDVSLRLGKLCIHGGPPCYEEAETVLTAALQDAESQGATRQAATALHLLALLCYSRHNYAETLRLLEQSPAPKQMAAPGPEVGQWYHYRGLVAAAQGELANAERLFFRAYQVYQELHHTQGLAEVCDSLANTLLTLGKTRVALQFANHSLELKRRLGDRHGEAISLGTKGRIEVRLARYADARAAFEQDLAIARELGDEKGIGIMLNSLGDVAFLSGDLQTAEAHYHDNLTEARGPLNDFFARFGLTWVQLAKGQLEEAAAEVARLQGILDRHSELAYLTDPLTGLRGALAWRQNDLTEGAHLLEQAIQGLQKQGQQLDTILFLYELRDLYQHSGKPERAVPVMAQALDLWAESGAERGIKDVEDWLRTVDQPSLVRLALERHLPAHLVQDVLSGKLSTRQPRLQRLTVLFCDLRDYTTLSERLPAVELVELLNEWFSEAARAVRRHGGVVDKFIGDAVMALFGVPDERDEAPAEAVRAALDMRDSLAAMNLRQQALAQPTLRIGIGVDTGQAVVGFIGSHVRQSYTAIGDLVNTASRLEGVTKDLRCDILISEEVNRVQARYKTAETTFRGKVKVKGREQEVAVYQVLGLR